MCVACIEYTKDKLNLKELKAALREMTMDDQKHFDDVERIIREHGSDPSVVKKELQKLLP